LIKYFSALSKQVDNWLNYDTSYLSWSYYVVLQEIFSSCQMVYLWHMFYRSMATDIKIFGRLNRGISARTNSLCGNYVAKRYYKTYY
jgi:hypothetical protein